MIGEFQIFSRRFPNGDVQIRGIWFDFCGVFENNADRERRSLVLQKVQEESFSTSPRIRGRESFASPRRRRTVSDVFKSANSISVSQTPRRLLRHVSLVRSTHTYVDLPFQLVSCSLESIYTIKRATSYAPLYVIQ